MGPRPGGGAGVSPGRGRERGGDRALRGARLPHVLLLPLPRGSGAVQLYILTDIEGRAGVANFEDYSYATGRFHAVSRRLLTLEVNAAVEGALAAGATEILVLDGHGSGAINVDELHPDALLLHGTGYPRTLGLERGFDALFFVGQHAMSNAARAGLAHTYSSRTIEQARLN